MLNWLNFLKKKTCIVVVGGYCLLGLYGGNSEEYNMGQHIWGLLSSIILLLNILAFYIYRNLYTKFRKVLTDIEEPKHSKLDKTKKRGNESDVNS